MRQSAPVLESLIDPMVCCDTIVVAQKHLNKCTLSLTKLPFCLTFWKTYTSIPLIPECIHISDGHTVHTQQTQQTVYSIYIVWSVGTCSILQKELHRCCVPWKTAIHGCIRGAWFNKWKQAVQIHYRSCSDVQLSLNIQYSVYLKKHVSVLSNNAP